VRDLKLSGLTHGWLRGLHVTLLLLLTGVVLLLSSALEFIIVRSCFETITVETD
jgi:hypothetical protein